jgi:hypothetical protein
VAETASSGFPRSYRRQVASTPERKGSFRDSMNWLRLTRALRSAPQRARARTAGLARLAQPCRVKGLRARAARNNAMLPCSIAAAWRPSWTRVDLPDRCQLESAPSAPSYGNIPPRACSRASH